MALKYSLQHVHSEGAKSNAESFSKLNSNLAQYAKLLADQGCFLNAYSYINDSNDVREYFVNIL